MRVIACTVTFFALLAFAGATNATTTTTTVDVNATSAPTTTTTTMTTTVDVNATMAPTTTTTLAPTTTTTMAGGGGTTTTTMAGGGGTTTTVAGGAGTTTTMAGGNATTPVYQVVQSTTVSGTATSTITGSFDFTGISNASLIEDATFQGAVGRAVASMCGVTPAQVTVALSMAGTRRLNQGRRMTSTITVSYTIIVAATDSSNIQSLLTNKSPAEATATLKAALAVAGIDGNNIMVTAMLNPVIDAATDGATRAFAPVMAAYTATAITLAALRFG